MNDQTIINLSLQTVNGILYDLYIFVHVSKLQTRKYS